MANSLDGLPLLALEQVSLDLPLKTIGNLATTNRSLRVHAAQFLKQFGTPEQITKVMEILNNMLPVLQGQGLCLRRGIQRFQDLTLRESKRVIQHIQHHHHSNTPLSTMLHKIYLASSDITAPIHSSWIVQQGQEPLSQEELAVLRSEEFQYILKNKSKFQSASDAIKNNFDAALIAVCQDGMNISHASSNLQNNPKLALAAVQQNPQAFLLLNIFFQNDLTITKEAVSRQGSVIKNASDTMKNHFDIAFTAVSNDGLAFLYLSPEMQNNFDIALAAVKQNPQIFTHLPNGMKNDPRIALAGVSQNPEVFYHLSESLRNNFDIALAAVSKDAGVLARTSLKDNFNIVLAAVKQNKLAIRLASPEMQQRLEIRAAAGVP